jgi:hypothetical protein
MKSDCTYCVLMLVLIASALVAVPIADQSERRVREMSYSLDSTIADRLLPDDDIVVIERSNDSVTEVPRPTVTQIIGGATVRADVVLILDVTESTGILIESGKWIETRITGTIRDVIRSSNDRQFSRGARIVARIDGGELVIGKVLVRARSGSLVPDVPVHQSYFLFVTNFNGILRPVYVPLQITDGRVRYAWSVSEDPDPKVSRPLEGLTVLELSEQVRLVPRLPK